MDLPLVFALWRAQGNSCWGGINTTDLAWLPVDDLLRHSRCKWYCPAASHPRVPDNCLEPLTSQIAVFREKHPLFQLFIQFPQVIAQLRHLQARHVAAGAPQKRLICHHGPECEDLAPRHGPVARPWLMEADEEGRRVRVIPKGETVPLLPLTSRLWKPKTFERKPESETQAKVKVKSKRQQNRKRSGEPHTSSAGAKAKTRREKLLAGPSSKSDEGGATRLRRKSSNKKKPLKHKH